MGHRRIATAYGPIRIEPAAHVKRNSQSVTGIVRSPALRRLIRQRPVVSRSPDPCCVVVSRPRHMSDRRSPKNLRRPAVTFSGQVGRPAHNPGARGELFVVPPLGGLPRCFLHQHRLKAGLQTDSSVCSPKLPNGLNHRLPHLFIHLYYYTFIRCGLATRA